MSDFCIVILAAGEGKRMKSGTPKVLHCINSKPMINYVVDAAKKLAPQKMVVVLARKRPEVGKVLPRDVKVAFQANQLGTADAVAVAVKYIPANVKHVIVLYGDTPLITEETISALYEHHLMQNASCTVLTTFLDNPKGYGRIMRNDSGQFMGIVEDKDANLRQKAVKEINTGLCCFRRNDLLEALEHVKVSAKTGEYYLTQVFSWLFNKTRKTEACVADDHREVLGVNSQGELIEASEIIRRRSLMKHMENGVTIDDFSTVFIDDSVSIGKGTRIFPFTYIENGVVIGSNCKVGPFTHLRSGAVLKDNVRVGNFAELKNSVIEQGSSMGHVGYLGDTSVGKNVNIGAGVIVANYDGKKKNRTVIKDNAFIGCDSVLVAPVVVGRRAVVGAGSVVTKKHDVRDGEVVVGVPARPINIKKRGVAIKRGHHE